MPVFRDAAEEAGKIIRQVVPLDITDEERTAAQMLHPFSEGYEDPFTAAQHQARALSDALAMKQQQLQQLQQQQAQASTGAKENKALIDQIPSDRESLFAFPIDWDKVAAYNVRYSTAPILSILLIVYCRTVGC
jgi:ABC-type transporter Mla subunit MlaD